MSLIKKESPLATEKEICSESANVSAEAARYDGSSRNMRIYEAVLFATGHQMGLILECSSETTVCHGKNFFACFGFDDAGKEKILDFLKNGRRRCMFAVSQDQIVWAFLSNRRYMDGSAYAFATGLTEREIDGWDQGRSEAVEAVKAYYELFYHCFFAPEILPDSIEFGYRSSGWDPAAFEEKMTAFSKVFGCSIGLHKSVFETPVKTLFFYDGGYFQSLMMFMVFGISYGRGKMAVSVTASERDGVTFRLEEEYEKPFIKEHLEKRLDRYRMIAESEGMAFLAELSDDSRKSVVTVCPFRYDPSLRGLKSSTLRASRRVYRDDAE